MRRPWRLSCPASSGYAPPRLSARLLPLAHETLAKCMEMGMETRMDGGYAQAMSVVCPTMKGGYIGRRSHEIRQG